jgi:hypothetical protein
VSASAQDIRKALMSAIDGQTNREEAAQARASASGTEGAGGGSVDFGHRRAVLAAASKHGQQMRASPHYTDQGSDALHRSALQQVSGLFIIQSRPLCLLQMGVARGQAAADLPPAKTVAEAAALKRVQLGVLDRVATPAVRPFLECERTVDQLQERQRLFPGTAQSDDAAATNPAASHAAASQPLRVRKSAHKAHL